MSLPWVIVAVLVVWMLSRNSSSRAPTAAATASGLVPALTPGTSAGLTAGCRTDGMIGCFVGFN